MLAYTKFGHGEPVILLHGLLGLRANMSMIAVSLADKYCVYTLDLRNHGESFHSDAMTYHDMAGDLIGFMNSQGIDKASMVGHSLGGKCAMQAALFFPERIKKLVVADISPKAYKPDWEKYLKPLLDLDLERLEKRADADILLSQAIPARVYRQFLLQNLERTSIGSFRWRSNLKILLEKKKDICAPISGSPVKTPALLIKGGDSTFVDGADKELMRALFPDTTLEVITGAGHLVHFEAREAFAKMVGDFLKETDGY